MKRNILIVIVGVLALMVLASNAFAAASKEITVKATVPIQNGGIDMMISKIKPLTPGGCNADGSLDDWKRDQTEIAFGELKWDSEFKIFRATDYYAVDIGVFDNSPTVWTLTHTVTSIVGGGTNLDNNVNVVFVKQLDDDNGTVLEKKRYYPDSHNRPFTKTQLSPGWLRIYYGVANGCTTGINVDAPLVKPVGIDKPGGTTFSGKVTITLTP